jgi:8-oxo-dGTP pyrophosphatase MutT (NUDIX family)
MPGDELVEVVDENGTVEAVVTRAAMRARNLRHRSVYIAVLSRDGARLLVHRRAAWKDVWPSRWDLAFGGVCAAGETWEAAAVRELAEETALEVDVDELCPLGVTAYDDSDVRVFGAVFTVRADGPFRFADGEVEEIAWWRRDELAAWLADPDRLVCPDSAALVAPHVALG